VADDRGLLVVIGAVNVDLVVEVPSLPRPGETVIGADLTRHPGGKGGNQAVAAARAGAAVRFLGAVGSDPDGDRLVDGLRAEGIDTRFISRVASPTGAALIAVAPDGQNQIAVAAGANGHLEADAVDAALAGASHVLISLEIPLAAAVRAVAEAMAAGCTVILNPAPAQRLPDAVLRADPILVLNERELVVVGDSEDPGQAVNNLRAAGVNRIIETRGAAGARLHAPGGGASLASRTSATVVDTTGAGDTFCGVLAAWLTHGADLAEGARAANVAAGLSVERAGARDGMPDRDRIARLLAADG